MARLEIHPDNSIRFFDERLTREDTGEALDDQDLSSVKVELLDPEDGSELESVTLSYEGDNDDIEEDWSGQLNADHELEDGDRVDVQYVADGGVNLKGTWVRRGVPVTEREVP